jgi:hypothetical protein
LAEGFSGLEAARHLGLSKSTIRTHLERAYRKLHVTTAAQAVAGVCHAGWLDPVDTSWEDHRVTAGQHLYLEAFDRFLLAKDDQVRSKARLEMTHQLGAMCIEKRIPVPAGGKRRPRSGIGPLMTLIEGADPLELTRAT